MAQMTNKCADDEVEYYIKECGDILGVSSQINNPDDPKATGEQCPMIGLGGNSSNFTIYPLV